MADVTADEFDIEWGDLQQKILKEAFLSNPDDLIPFCEKNSGGDNFVGEPRADPATWCVCDMITKSGLFPAMKSTESPCAYKTLPTKEISITIKPVPSDVSITSCRWVT